MGFSLQSGVFEPLSVTAAFARSCSLALARTLAGALGLGCLYSCESEGESSESSASSRRAPQTTDQQVLHSNSSSSLPSLSSIRPQWHRSRQP